jgi:hypothetical protein
VTLGRLLLLSVRANRTARHTANLVRVTKPRNYLALGPHIHDPDVIVSVSHICMRDMGLWTCPNHVLTACVCPRVGQPEDIRWI